MSSRSTSTNRIEFDEREFRAERMPISASRFVAELVTQQLGAGWPPRFFEDVVGSWEGEPLVRAEQGVIEERDAIR
jgi:hypothetical protein